MRGKNSHNKEEKKKKKRLRALSTLCFLLLPSTSMARGHPPTSPQFFQVKIDKQQLKVQSDERCIIMYHTDALKLGLAIAVLFGKGSRTALEGARSGHWGSVKAHLGSRGPTEGAPWGSAEA